MAGRGPEPALCGVAERRHPSCDIQGVFDLYLEVTKSALLILVDMAAMGEANENLLGGSHLEWAEVQAKNMIRSEMTKIAIWVRHVCDKRQNVADADPDELCSWRKWQALKLIVMTPSRYLPYQPSAIWERFDAVRSRELLAAFAEDYALHVEMLVENFISQAQVELAKRPKPAAAAPEPSQNTKGKARGTGLTSREEAKKTQAKYARWRKAYLRLKKVHPSRSDVWISLKIAKMELAKGSSAGTIRRRMKRK